MPTAVKSIDQHAARALESMRTPPHSLEAEQAVLGGLLIDNSRIDDVLEIIGEEDFYRQDSRLIFGTMTLLHKMGIEFDTVTISEHLQNRKMLDQVGGLAYLASMARDVPTSANVKAYAAIVHAKSKARQTIRIGMTMVNDAYMLGGDESINEGIAALLELNEDRTTREYDMATVMSMSWDVLDKSSNAVDGLVGVNTGFKTLNQKLGGLHRGDLLVCGARPAVGKTALLVNLAERAGVRAGIISAEQPVEQLGMRMLAVRGGISVHRMRTGRLTEDDWKKLSKATAELGQTEIWMNDKPAQRFSDVLRQARKWKVKRNIDVLYVDYLQKIKADDDRMSLRERVSYVVEGMKNIARELDIPVFALAMVNREVELRDDKQPQLSDFKESGTIEQEADIAVTLHREGAYDANKDDGSVTMLVCKNRHGPTGKIKLAWSAEHMRYDDPDAEPAL